MPDARFPMPDATSAPQLPRLAYTPEEVAVAIGMNPDLLRDWIRDGKVPHLRSSRKSIRMTQRHIDELLVILEKRPVEETTPIPGQTARSAARRNATARRGA